MSEQIAFGLHIGSPGSPLGHLWTGTALSAILGLGLPTHLAYFGLTLSGS
jgi:hypothetical protein